MFAQVSRRVLSFLDFTPGQFPLNLLLANRLRGAATDDNLERILSETKLGVNRWKKILKVIGLSQVDIIIAFTFFKAVDRRWAPIKPGVPSTRCFRVLGWKPGSGLIG